MRDEDDEYRVHLDSGSGQVPAEHRPEFGGPRPIVDMPFCLGILGDFSGAGAGHAASPRPDLGGRALRRVTPENVLTFAGLQPRLRIQGLEPHSAPEEIRLSSLDDLQPAGLFERLDSFELLRDTRRRLVERPEHPAPRPSPGAAGAALESGMGSEPVPGGILDAVLDVTKDQGVASGAGTNEDLEAFVRRVVRPHVIASAPGHPEALDQLDGRINELLNRVIHDTEFQTLEALWRAVVFLLSRVEVSTRLRVYLLDISRAELGADLLGTDEPADWSLGSLFLDPITENGEELRWAGLVGAYTFGDEPDDIPLLQRIGFLAGAAEVPWFAGATPDLVGAGLEVTSVRPAGPAAADPLWAQLRENPEAAWICLAYPPFLLRRPYEAPKARTGALAFAETVRDSRDLLWGNPAVLCGIGLASAFSNHGWPLRLDQPFRIDGVPLHETPSEASAVQTRLSITEADRLRDLGLTAIVGFRHEPAVLVRGVGSISTRERGIRGWWGVRTRREGS